MATAPRKGPLPLSCDACRGCAKKGIRCVTSRLPLSQRMRIGPRIEAAKALCGSTNLAPTSPHQQLVASALAGDISYELLSLYTEAGGGTGPPLYAPPVADFVGLQSRFDAAGRKVAALSIEDQLLFRVISASSAPFLSSKAASSSSMARQLLEVAQSSADALGVHRKPTVAHVVSLLLLHQAAGRGEIATDDADTYLSSAAAHVRALRHRAPVAISGPTSESTSALVWAVTIFDACSAVERSAPPFLSGGDFDELFLGGAGFLTTQDALEEALRLDPWSLTGFLVQNLLFALVLLRRLALFLDHARTVQTVLDRSSEVDDMMATMDKIYEWGKMAFGVVQVHQDPLQRVVALIYLNGTYASTLFAELAILKHLERLSEEDGRRKFPSSPATLAALHLDRGRARLQHSACTYLRVARTTPEPNYVAIQTGTFWSTSRLCDIVQAVLSASVWDQALFPDGPQDKLETLNFLQATLDSLQRAYPDRPLVPETLNSIASEVVLLQMLLVVPPEPRPILSSSASTLSALPSLTRLNSWVHVNDSSVVQIVMVPLKHPVDGFAGPLVEPGPPCLAPTPYHCIPTPDTAPLELQHAPTSPSSSPAPVDLLVASLDPTSLLLATPPPPPPPSTADVGFSPLPLSLGMRYSLSSAESAESWETDWVDLAAAAGIVEQASDALERWPAGEVLQQF
ncbi:uncharacterized protein RHOBADRAFT_53669 [Rhodotorula graminis WP1]|uniref:Transcription factor domain-containing protein n=1 Tax=Rhodotorula graminis (strain WP1) TaxID=578459 RepID=A0A194S2H0_RHOGW|nr:uncharacterized protein RHOBADRAFT_53669 [Rhodotorula graminis WP1]KPV74715.1 hypothetical protein RHOBADRAFT_53669 [Rhodotorula graminis WP1]